MALYFARLPAGPVGAQETQKAAAESGAVDRDEEGGRQGHGRHDQREGAHVRSLEGPADFRLAHS